MARLTISVVVPTLEEAAELPATLAALAAGATAGGATEVLVSDSGSTDGTPELAGRLGARVLRPPVPLTCRADACIQGAAAAGGDVLLFLDADTRVPNGWDAAVLAALADPEVAGGAFELTLDGAEPGLRRVEWINRLRYRRSHLFYGDQAVFARAAAYRRAGGFPAAAVLESDLLCRRLKAEGRLVLLPLAVVSSARRFRQGGIARVFLRDAWLWLRHLLRLPNEARGRAYWAADRGRT
ncbi:MAG TPA: glycosyltransferase [Thermoanaerobaculia bacterium]|nr:glycosyltransferase [Thermoanaerobaculia bacterium]